MPSLNFKIIVIYTIVAFGFGFIAGIFYKNYQIKSAYQKAAKQVSEILNSNPNQIPTKK